MYWLDKIVDDLILTHPEGEIVVSSGVSPSGKYHVGTLREVLTADALTRGIKQKGRSARHIHVVDDLDPFRKLPAGLPAEYEKYLGQPLCDVPAPEGDGSYADFYLKDFLDNVERLGIALEVLRSHEKYRSGYFVPTIEMTLLKIDKVRECLESISGRKLDDQWSPIQINEGGYLKKRPFVAINTDAKEIQYLDKNGEQQSISYLDGKVKLDWRLDWPARWSLLGVMAEPFGRDHATKGGSYDTGKELVKIIFNSSAPYPVPYDFINRTGDTKKMSKSAGNTVTVSDLLRILPPEIIRYFVLRYSPDKQLYFDEAEGLIRLIDDYATLLGKADKTNEDDQIIAMSQVDSGERVISNIPFSHLVSSYQAARFDMDRTLQILKRTEYAEVASEQAEIIGRELAYIKNWLDSEWAPESVKFCIEEQPDYFDSFSEQDRTVLSALADAIDGAPDDANAQWFHDAIYDIKERMSVQPQDVFKPLYKALINKDRGPRAGHFLADLFSNDGGREWLTNRLRLIS